VCQFIKSDLDVVVIWLSASTVFVSWQCHIGIKVATENDGGHEFSTNMNRFVEAANRDILFSV